MLEAVPVSFECSVGWGDDKAGISVGPTVVAVTERDRG